MGTKIARLIGVWTVTSMLGTFSILVGAIKFSQAASWDRSFAHWGYPTWFRPIVGLAELAAGLLVFVPRLAAYGAILMGIVMVGALSTHILYGELNRLPPPLVLLTLSAVVWLARRSR